MHWVKSSSPDHALGRFGHTAVTIDASEDWGTVLVCVYGGVCARSEPHDQQTALSDVLVLQVDADTWVSPQLCNEGPGQRAFHCACAVGRKMFMFGGHVMSYEAQFNKRRRSFFQDLWQLDTGTWEWSQVVCDDGVQPPRRDMCTLVAVGGDRLLLCGGRSESTRAIGDLWLFDIKLARWSQLVVTGSCPPPRKMHTCTVMGDGTVVVFGGEKDSGVLDDLWLLRGLGTQEAPRWLPVKVRPCPSSRFGHAAAGVGGSLVVYGGCLDQTSFLSITRSYTQCRELWTLHLASLKWTRVEFEGVEVPAERMLHTLCALPGGRLLLLGGRGTTSIFRDVWWLSVYDAAHSLGADEQQQQQQQQDSSAPPVAVHNLGVEDPPAPLAPSASTPSLLQALLSPMKPAPPAPDSARGEAGAPTISRQQQQQQQQQSSQPPAAAPQAPSAPQDIPGKAAPSAPIVKTPPRRSPLERMLGDPPPVHSESPPLQMQPLRADPSRLARGSSSQASVDTRQQWRRRVADAGSSAIDRLSTTVSSLLERPGLPPMLARLAAKEAGQASASLSHLATLQGRSQDDATLEAPHSAAWPAVDAAAAAVAVEVMRAAVGLPAASPATSRSAPPLEAHSPQQLQQEAQSALLAVGQHITRQRWRQQQPRESDAPHARPPAGENDEDVLTAARKHLASTPAAELPLTLLGALLKDYRCLASQQASAGLQQLLQRKLAARGKGAISSSAAAQAPHQQTNSSPLSSSLGREHMSNDGMVGPGVGTGGTKQEHQEQQQLSSLPDLTPRGDGRGRMVSVAGWPAGAMGQWQTGLLELRLRDVGELQAQYRSLLKC